MLYVVIYQQAPISTPLYSSAASDVYKKQVSKRIERQVINEIDMSALVNDEECIACEG